MNDTPDGSSTTDALVVGGPHDGQWIKIDPSYPVWSAYITPKESVLDWSPNVPLQHTVESRRADYRRHIWHAEGREMFVLAPIDGDGPYEIMRKLMEHYHERR